MPADRRGQRDVKRDQRAEARRLLVVMPSWLGDCVMATPTLRALRRRFPKAHIAALVKREMRPVLEGNPWVDRLITVRANGRGAVGRQGRGGLRLIRRLAAAAFDTAVLLPNSFRTAMLVRMAGIRRRIGYDRDGRGGLLTDRLLPRRTPQGYVPVPTVEAYLGIARYLGAESPDPSMQLFTRPANDQRASALLNDAGWAPSGPDDARPPLIVLNPGASFGDAKRWSPKQYGEVADQCVERFGAAVAVSSAPSERAIADAVHRAASHPLIDLPSIGIDLALLKSVIRLASLLVTNDTGTRHIAAALGTPVVTIFGPTNPAWSQIDFQHERQVYVDVYCRPCQKKQCPLRHTPDDHQCMTKIDAQMVMSRVGELLADVSPRRCGGSGDRAAGAPVAGGPAV